MSKIIQNLLVEHYTESKGLLTELALGQEEFNRWNEITAILYKQALDLNKQDWNNTTELKECSRNSEIWSTIRKIYDEIIGPVNNYALQRNTNLASLIVAYVSKKHIPRLSRYESFRLKFESFLAREIIAQNHKSEKELEDYTSDQKIVRSLRKKDTSKLETSNEFLIKCNGDKIDFTKISIEGYKKVCSIVDNPHKYKEYISDSDVKLSEKYILFYFKQIDATEYLKSWAKVLLELGITPTNKGIDFLARNIDKKMKEVMYDAIIKQHLISPVPFICMRFCQEFYRVLKEVLDDKRRSKSAEKGQLKKDSTWKEDSVLYIYKGRIACHAQNHTMQPATAIFTGRNEYDISLNVEYCGACNKFYMSYSVYEHYREHYGILLGKIKMDSASTSGVDDIILSEFSPLKLCGYSVNQQDDYSKAERQYIISKVIEKKILSKIEVIRYLEYFISRNGQKSNNSVALQKWKEDLDFVLQYKLSEQDKYKIKRIEKY